MFHKEITSDAASFLEAPPTPVNKLGVFVNSKSLCASQSHSCSKGGGSTIAVPQH